ncbi:MAG: 30S ribosomal protein S6 [Lachnospiraceae bacterium]|nr:30S ribosomal protein S6 [Lachnospiraceae bacterium]
MNKYELCVVISAKIEDDARADVLERVKALVERAGGTISDIDEWGKKRLAYEIQKMNEGYYYFIHFEAEPTAPRQIEDRLRIVDDILRFLCVSMEEA